MAFLLLGQNILAKSYLGKKGFVLVSDCRKMSLCACEKTRQELRTSVTKTQANLCYVLSSLKEQIPHKGTLMYCTVLLDNCCLEWTVEKAETKMKVSLESAEEWMAFKSCEADGTTSGLVAGNFLGVGSRQRRVTFKMIIFAAAMQTSQRTYREEKSAGAGEVAQWLRTLAACPENPGFNSKNSCGSSQSAVAPVPGDLTPSSRHICTQNTIRMKEKGGSTNTM